MALASCRTAIPTSPIVGAPWSIDPAGLPTQRLYQVEATRGGDSTRLRLLLRIWSAGRFELTASDLLGRRAWRVEVDGRRGRLVGKEISDGCRFDGQSPLELPEIPLPLAASSLPAVLLGRLPAQPRTPAVSSTSFLDAAGRRWHYGVADGTLVEWEVSTGAKTIARYGYARGRASLDLGDSGFRLEWRESSRAALTAAATPIPDLDSLPECRESQLS